MQDEKQSKNIIAYCGLICSKCGAFIKGKCQGCHSEKPMFKNCPVKKCNVENNYVTCVECQEFKGNFKECKKLNSFISKIFAFVFRTDRVKNLNRIKEIGLEQFKEENKK